MSRYLRNILDLSVSSKFMKKSLNNVFGKYILMTNIISSGVLLAIGDIIQQEIEYRRKIQAKRYDYNRLGRMFIIGIALGPVHHYYYKYLDVFLPKSDITSVGKKILADQFIASPLFITLFFYGMNFLEDKSNKQCKNEMKDKFLTVYLMDWLIWPPTQFVNFYYLSPQYRVLYINAVTMVYDVFLSHIKHKKADSVEVQITN